MGDVLLLLVTGATAGWAAGRIMRGRGFGIVLNTLLGMAGGLLGSIVSDLLGVDRDGWIVEMVIAVAGALALLALLDLVRRRVR